MMAFSLRAWVSLFCVVLVLLQLCTPACAQAAGGGGGGGGGGYRGGGSHGRGGSGDCDGGCVGAIVGIVLGITFVICLAAGIPLYLRRRRRAAAQIEAHNYVASGAAAGPQQLQSEGGFAAPLPLGRFHFEGTYTGTANSVVNHGAHPTNFDATLAEEANANTLSIKGCGNDVNGYYTVDGHSTRDGQRASFFKQYNRGTAVVYKGSIRSSSFGAGAAGPQQTGLQFTGDWQVVNDREHGSFALVLNPLAEGEKGPRPFAGSPYALGANAPKPYNQPAFPNSVPPAPVALHTVNQPQYQPQQAQPIYPPQQQQQQQLSSYPVYPQQQSGYGGDYGGNAPSQQPHPSQPTMSMLPPVHTATASY